MITLCLNQQNTDQYFNLAAEEYFLKNVKENFFILWRSRPSVVVGKHQNALAEINHEFIQKYQIPVARRLSGGGTVFHDPGNVNFTFIRNVEKIQEINFGIFVVPVIEALKKLGVEAYISGRNDILIDGKKISGNAEHVYKKRVLHHGTLLFNSHLETVIGALKVDLSKFEDKAIRSNPSEVTNISNHLPNPMSVEEFTDFLFDEIRQNNPEAKVYDPNPEDLKAIQKLSNEKYQTWEWIFGYSPRYRFTNKMKSGKGDILVSLLVERGIISEVCISGAIAVEFSQKLIEMLPGCRHEYEVIKSSLFKLKDLFQVHGVSTEGFLKTMF